MAVHTMFPIPTLALRLHVGGVNEKKILGWMVYFFFYSVKPQSQVWILILPKLILMIIIIVIIIIIMII